MLQHAPFALALALLGACSNPSLPASAPAAPLPSEREAAPPSPKPPLAVSSPQAPAILPGDDQLPEPWRTRFRSWLSAQVDPTYVRMLGSQVVSNAVTVVLQRRSEANGVCLEGPSRLEVIQDETAKQASHELQHFGEDCCPGTACKRTAEGWNLHYLALLAARNWQGLSLLVPVKGQLVLSINGGEEPPVKVTRQDVAAGRFERAPGCGFINTTPSCDEIDENSAGFGCRCDGGGYHVNYVWQREGAGFVLVAIDEESH